MASVTVHCPHCQSAQVYRHGQTRKDTTGDCHCVFQLTYSYLARKTICFSRSAELHEKVIEKYMLY